MLHEYNCHCIHVNSINLHIYEHFCHVHRYFLQLQISTYNFSFCQIRNLESFVLGDFKFKSRIWKNFNMQVSHFLLFLRKEALVFCKAPTYRRILPRDF